MSTVLRSFVVFLLAAVPWLVTLPAQALPRLAGAADCTPTAPIPWGQASDVATAACWSFTPADSGAYLSVEGPVTGPDGVSVCQAAFESCTLQGGTTYTITALQGAPSRAGVRSLADCTTPLVGRFLGTLRGDLQSRQALCATFDAEPGDQLLPAQAVGTAAQIAATGVYDASGATVCEHGVTSRADEQCTPLEAGGLHRLVVMPYNAGAVEVGLMDLAEPRDCVDLPASTFGEPALASDITLPADSRLGCATFPGTDLHGGGLLRWTASGAVRTFPYPQAPGYCLPSSATIGEIACWRPAATGPVTILVQAKQLATSVSTSRFVIGSQAGCVPATSTRAGGPETPGALGGFLEVDCVRVPARSGETFSTGLWADGGMRADEAPGYGGCSPQPGLRCATQPTGPVSMLVRRTASDRPGTYGLEPWHIATDGVPAEGCRGPLPSSVDLVLDGESTGRCWSPPLADRYGATVDLGATGDEVLVHPARNPGESCRRFGSCTVTDSLVVARTGVSGNQVLGPRQTAHLDLTCRPSCKTDVQRLFAVDRPVLSRDPAVGGRVGAVDLGVWLGSPDSVAYQWLRDGEPIEGATGSTYVPFAVDLDRGLSVRLTGAQGGVTATATSVAATVTKGAAPRLTNPPRIMGAPVAGQRVRAYVGSWTPRPTGYRYAWRVGSYRLPATGSSVVLKSAWIGRPVTVTVSAIVPGRYWGQAATPRVWVRRS